MPIGFSAKNEHCTRALITKNRAEILQRKKAEVKFFLSSEEVAQRNENKRF
jgi:hypothetical protein